MARFGESRAGLRIACLVAIVAGVVVLRVTDPVASEDGSDDRGEVASSVR
jgi:hypothetical protein